MRSEGWFGWMRPRDEKRPSPTPRDKWLTVGLKANIEWPQVFTIIAISLAEEVLNENDFDFGEFIASEAEPKQVEKIRDAAKTSHETYEIKVRWKWLLLGKGRIKRLWEQYRESTAILLARAWNAVSSDSDRREIAVFGYQEASPEKRKSVIAAMSADLRDPNSAEKIQLMRQIFRIFLDVLKSQEGQALAKDYKIMLQNQERGLIPVLDPVENVIAPSMWVEKFHRLVRQQLQSSPFDNLSVEVKAAVLRVTA